MLREWAYGPAYSSSAERTNTLDAWPTYYNSARPHGALSHRPPNSRLPDKGN